MQVLQLFLKKIDITAFFRVLQANTTKEKYIVQIMRCKQQMKQIETKESFEGTLASLKCTFLAQAWDISIN